MTKLSTIFWFLKRPEYYPQILQILKRSKNKSKEETRAESTQWCRQNCISQKEAYHILKARSDFEDLAIIYPSIMRMAEEREKNTPVKMGGEGAISLIYHLVKDSGAKKILETGVAYGWSSLAILLGIMEDKDARLISNDMPYVNAHNEDFVGIVVPENLKAHWDLQRLPDVTGIPQALKKFNQSIDFAHYDSDKSYTGRAFATPLLWNALKSNGILMMDDINDNIYFREFCEMKNRKPVIIEHYGKFVGIIVK